MAFRSSTKRCRTSLRGRSFKALAVSPLRVSQTPMCALYHSHRWHRQKARTVRAVGMCRAYGALRRKKQWHAWGDPRGEGVRGLSRDLRRKWEGRAEELRCAGAAAKRREKDAT